jgi:hypothetical protein
LRNDASRARDEFIIAAVFEVKKEIPAETYKLDYHGGERSPRLVRDQSKPGLLSRQAQGQATSERGRF